MKLNQPSKECVQFWFEFMLKNGAIQKVMEDEAAKGNIKPLKEAKK